MLSARELVRNVKEVKEEIGNTAIKKADSKIVEWDGRFRDQEVLARVSTMVHSIRVPRVSIKSSLSVAEWSNTTKQVVITKNTGKQDVGELMAEEALHLLENNSLYLTSSGVPLSIHAAFTLLLSPVTGVSTTDYMVYSKLARAGYRVLRHLDKEEKAALEDNKVDSAIDTDIDISLLAPLYGVSLVQEPGTEAPSWLQDIRDSLVPHAVSGQPPPWSQYGLDSWVQDILMDLLEEVVDVCEDRKRKRRRSTSDKSCKLARLESVGGHKHSDDGGHAPCHSPKYEVSSNDGSYGFHSAVCVRCARFHLGGEDSCLAKGRACTVCGGKGHISNVHMVDEREVELRQRIVEVLGVSQWNLWGRYAPEIVTIEEEEMSNDDNEVREAFNVPENDDNAPEDNSVVDEGNKLYINPFHDDEEDEIDTNLIINIDDDVNRILETATVEDNIMSTTSQTTFSDKIQSLTRLNSLIGGLVNSQVAQAKAIGIRTLPNSHNNVFTCNLCDIDSSSKEDLQKHYSGKGHMKKLKSKSGVGQLTCKVCSIKTSGSAALVSHYQGKKHLKAVALLAQARVIETAEDVELVTEQFRASGAVSDDDNDIEIVTCAPPVSRRVSDSARIVLDRENILGSDLPDCAGKSHLILNRPANHLLPGNTWVLDRLSSFLDIEQMRSTQTELSDEIEADVIGKNTANDVLEKVVEENPSLWCGVCQFGLEIDVELLGHIQSELHIRNLRKARRGLVETMEIDLTEVAEATDIIVVEDDSPAPSKRDICTPFTKPFRGFWSASEVVRPLASVDGCYQQIRNFGFHSRSTRQERGRGGRGSSGDNGADVCPWNFRGVSGRRVGNHFRHQRSRNLTVARVTGRGRGREGWSRGDLKKWVRDTESYSGEEEEDIENIDEETMGVEVDCMEVANIRELDLEDMARRAVSWAAGNRGEEVGQTSPASATRNTVPPIVNAATYVVDLSSSDEDNQKASQQESDQSHHNKLSFNISNIRSLSEGPSTSALKQQLTNAYYVLPRSKVIVADSRTSSYLTTSSSSSSSHDDVSAHSELRYFKNGPMASLWSYQGSVGPLLSPEMGGSLREVHSRLTMDPTISTQYIGGFVEELVVSYDLYLAEHYKKTQQTLPNYRVIIQTFSSPFPNPASLAHLDKRFPDQVPFLFAIVSGGTVTFFSLDRVELPRYFRDI